jgi:deazaflavin-dependent oxidoreductase (nitroreductase family)
VTATHEQELRLPPRPLIRTFWFLHRLAYRVTGGRFGLSRPVPGVKFGMMRLHSVGRRSGKSRVVIIGYYEDGPNLVTLAMNGWGKSDPAWWLNLQATPDTFVDLADGRRAVTARAATADEQSRLWAEFGNYPGWGADLDALVERRARQTTIVVFEPAGKGVAS